MYEYPANEFAVVSSSESFFCSRILGFVFSTPFSRLGEFFAHVMCEQLRKDTTDLIVLGAKQWVLGGQAVV